MREIILFPGQGAQYIHMCSRLYADDIKVKKIFKDAGDVLGFDLWKMIDEGDLKTLTRTTNAQPAVFTSSYALYRHALCSGEIRPDVLIGHSLGEVSALACADAISFEHALTFIKKRSEIMEQAYAEKIGFSGIVTDISSDILDSQLEILREKGYVAISGYNSLNQLMVAGEKEIEKLLDNLAYDLGGQYIPYRMIPMKVSAPYHSELMHRYKSDMEKLVNNMEIKSPLISMLSTVTGEYVNTADEVKNNLISQMTKPILWNQAINRVMQEGDSTFWDIGPNTINMNLLLEDYKCIVINGYDKKDVAS